MVNVNDILKRQLLLMKFDSGVTLKENYEKVSGKKLLNEGENADRVKKIVNGCYAGRDNNKYKNSNTSSYEQVADNFKDAFYATVFGSIATPTTDCKKFKMACDEVSKNYTYSDLCNMIFTYDARHHKNNKGDGFYGDLNGDMQTDSNNCGWSEVLRALNSAVEKTEKWENTQKSNASTTQTTTTQTTATQTTATQTDDQYKKVGNKDKQRTFDWFRRKFPCVFTKRRVTIDEVYNNGEHDFILLLAPNGETVQLFWDGYLRKKSGSNIVDVQWVGKPAKLFCDTSDNNKIVITAR
jgi:hypothetical protein